MAHKEYFFALAKFFNTELVHTFKLDSNYCTSMCVVYILHCVHAMSMCDHAELPLLM